MALGKQKSSLVLNSLAFTFQVLTQLRLQTAAGKPICTIVLGLRPTGELGKLERKLGQAAASTTALGMKADGDSVCPLLR